MTRHQPSPEQRVTLDHPGRCRDLARSAAFYHALGWCPRARWRAWPSTRCTAAGSSRSTPGRARGRHGPRARALGTGAVTLAQNHSSEEEVDEAFHRALRAGATAIRGRRRPLGRLRGLLRRPRRPRVGDRAQPLLAARAGRQPHPAQGMTASAVELGFYALGLAGLWLTPGPVWVALTARALAGGFAAAWPLAVGVTIGPPSAAPRHPRVAWDLDLRLAFCGEGRGGADSFHGRTMASSSAGQAHRGGRAAHPARALGGLPGGGRRCWPTPRPSFLHGDAARLLRPGPLTWRTWPRSSRLGRTCLWRGTSFSPPRGARGALPRPASARLNPAAGAMRGGPPYPLL
jgi:hypothetical protein